MFYYIFREISKVKRKKKTEIDFLAEKGGGEILTKVESRKTNK